MARHLRTWHYRTGFGVFVIREREDDRFCLYIDDEVLGAYDSPGTAADEVFFGTTGFTAWDNANLDEPHDLSEWSAGEPP